MSELTTVARPYARAVFEMAESTGSLGEWSEMLSFMGSVAGDKEVSVLLATPKMAKQAGAKAFLQICDGKLNDQAKNLVNMLAENDRLSLLPEISEIYEVLKDEAEGSIEALVTSAKALTESEEMSISDALKKRLGRDVKIKVSVDETLLGGAIIQAGDLVIDGTLKGRLSKMTSVMAN
ncbi:MAG: F0F1 ATP synthase subunit delta [Thiotrichales bacterium]|nr:MAG: F0F1 ATP synthase subunit delta [Thiotrichales bacterium]